MESKINIIKGDITKIECDCIVNAAKQSLADGGGVCGAIYKAAGRFRLMMACKKLKGCEIGQAKITEGFKLPAKFIIHTVGPKYSADREVDNKLRDCYINSLNLAKSYDIHSIAFPLISSGVYKYPLDLAVSIAVETIQEWLSENSDWDICVTICCFDEEAYNACKEVV